MKNYPALCEMCFQDLYRAAVLCTGDEGIASRLVERTCVRGVHACDGMHDARMVKIELTDILFRLCIEQKNEYVPGQRGYCEQMASFDKYERAMIIFRHCSGLKAAEFAMAIGMTAEYASQLLTQVRQKVYMRG